MPQFSVVTERIFVVIKNRVLAMLLNMKLNDTAQKIMWEETVHTCERVRNSIKTTGCTKSPFEIFYREKPNIVGSFS